MEVSCSASDILEVVQRLGECKTTAIQTAYFDNKKLANVEYLLGMCKANADLGAEDRFEDIKIEKRKRE